MRWSEEVELLQEEMHRVLQFFQWQAEWWSEQGSTSPPHSPAQDEGLRAYSARQSLLRRQLATRCTHMWRFVEEYIRLGTDELPEELAESAAIDEE